RTIAHQAAGIGKLAPQVGRRQRTARGECYDLRALVNEERIGTYKQRLDLLLGYRGEGNLDLALVPGIMDDKPDLPGYVRLRLSLHFFTRTKSSTVFILQIGELFGVGGYLLQQFKGLRD